MPAGVSTPAAPLGPAPEPGTAGATFDTAPPEEPGNSSSDGTGAHQRGDDAQEPALSQEAPPAAAEVMLPAPENATGARGAPKRPHKP